MLCANPFMRTCTLEYASSPIGMAMEMAIPSSLTLRTIPPLDSPHATYIKVLGRTRGCERRSWICVCPGNCCVEVLTISSLEGRTVRVSMATFTTGGEEGPFDGWRKARYVPGRNAS